MQINPQGPLPHVGGQTAVMEGVSNRGSLIPHPVSQEHLYSYSTGVQYQSCVAVYVHPGWSYPFTEYSTRTWYKYLVLRIKLGWGLHTVPHVPCYHGRKQCAFRRVTAVDKNNGVSRPDVAMYQSWKHRNEGLCVEDSEARWENGVRIHRDIVATNVPYQYLLRTDMRTYEGLVLNST